MEGPETKLASANPLRRFYIQSSMGKGLTLELPGGSGFGYFRCNAHKEERRDNLTPTASCLRGCIVFGVKKWIQDLDSRQWCRCYLITNSTAVRRELEAYYLVPEVNNKSYLGLLLSRYRDDRLNKWILSRTLWLGAGKRWKGCARCGKKANLALAINTWQGWVLDKMNVSR